MRVSPKQKETFFISPVILIIISLKLVSLQIMVFPQNSIFSTQITFLAQ